MSSPSEATPSNTNGQKRRRVGGQGACHNCRRRKIRCDGNQPGCAACQVRDEDCRYDKDNAAGQIDGALLVEAIGLLNARPSQEAVQTLVSLRDVSDAEAIMAHLRAGAGAGFGLSPQPSDLVAMSGTAQRSLVALELEARHPFLYPVLPAIDIASPTGILQRLVHPAVAPNDEAPPAQKALLLHDGAIDDKAGALVNAFCAEAESLWETERTSPSTLNMAAALFLSFGYLVQGKNHVVLAYMSEAIRMGTHLGLFGVDRDVAGARTAKMTAEQAKAASHTTWGVFNWIMLMALFYYQSEIDYPIHPPYLPIPEEDDVGRAFGTESSPPRTRYVGDTFPTVCGLWRIMHEVTIAYGKDRSNHQLRDRVSLEFAEYKYRELLAWADNLPSGLVRTERNPHHVVIFHIWLHAAILDIFRPFLCRPGQPTLQLKTFSSPKSSPDHIYAASVNQLKRLVIVYRMSYESSGFTIVWHTALLYVANAVLQSPDDGEWLFYFLLCLYGYQGLRRCYPVVEAIAGALLSMAMRNGHMSSRVARRIMTELKGKSLRRVPREIRAPFMADLDLAMSDPSAATAEKLAGMFEENALMVDFTNVFDTYGA
ncbi:hypothetical protein QQZ08_009996 [Neonectria magnoliae]|uniref:Zn(2)-C6 fungal-type domain-containing protein n=1 Tax=Neonectria magnoliae TaxID=2732573 RepID=A0ABR1HK62_9HYPO